MADLELPLRGRTILIADDHPIVREALSLTLESAGAVVLVADDGHAALRQLHTHRCDLLITDIDMPKLDGIELLALVRRLPRHAKLPVMLFSSYADVDRVVRAGRLGACGYLLKSGFDRATILARVVAALEPARPNAAIPSRGEQRSGSPDDAAERHGDTTTTLADPPEATPGVDSSAAAPGTAAGGTAAADPSIGPLVQTLRNCNAPGTDLADVTEGLESDPAAAAEFLRLGNASLVVRGRNPAPNLRELVPRIGLTSTRVLIAGLLAQRLAADSHDASAASIRWDEVVGRCIAERSSVESTLSGFLRDGAALLERIRAASGKAIPASEAGSIAQGVSAAARAMGAASLGAAAEALTESIASGSSESMGRSTDRVSAELTAALAVAGLIVRGLQRLESSGAPPAH